MKKSIITLLTFVSTFTFANVNYDAKDLEHLVQEQSIISELIFETFLFKDSEDWKDIITKKRLQFELNQKTLLEISEKEYMVLNTLMEENITLWKQFEEYLSKDKSEEFDSSLFDLSTQILLSNEKIINIATHGVYLK